MKNQSKDKGTASEAFVPYTAELVTSHAQQPIKHYIQVYRNGGFYAIELHKENPPTSTSRIGLYGKQWIITKARGDETETEFVVTKAGGWITRYTLPTQMARKLKGDIAIYEAQQQTIEKPASQPLNTNQHYISQVLLRRFSTKGKLQKYMLKYGKWSGAAPRSVFSGFG